MTDLTINSNFLCVSGSAETLVIDLGKKCEKHILSHIVNIPKEKSKIKSEHDEIYDGGVPIVSSAFSSCGTLFACCSHKYLSVWNVGTWELFNKKVVQRSISKITFSPKTKFIVVADKSGDVYLHSLKDFLSPGKLILGHVSMLLDILVTKDEQFIISCDRDEKIRVSHFPKAYNIECYCLGHEEFVTSLNILPNDESLLLSSSGDGSLRLWNFLSGKEITCYNIKGDIATSLKTFDDEVPIIYKTAMLEINNDITAVCSLVYKTNAVWVHYINCTLQAIEFKQIIHTDFEPYCLQTLQDTKEIWFLQLNDQRPLITYKFSCDKFIECYDDSIKTIKNIVEKNVDNLRISSLQERLVSSLCKKKFDNEDEYYKRKRERLEAEKVKRHAKS